MGFRSFSGVAAAVGKMITTAVSAAKAVEAAAAGIGPQGGKNWSLDKNSAAGLVQSFFTNDDEDAACFIHGCRYFNAATTSTFTTVVLLILLLELMFNTIASFDEAGTKAAGFAQEPHFRSH